MREVYVGMDLGSTICTAVAVSGRGKLLEEGVFPTTAENIIGFVERQPGAVQVMFEEGELAAWVHSLLVGRSDRVVACDPTKNSFSKPHLPKGDLEDARNLAKYLRMGVYRPVFHGRDEAMEGLKVAVKHYDESSKRASRIKTQIKARLRTQGVIEKSCRVYGRTGRQQAMARVENQVAREVLSSEFALLDHMLREKASARRLLCRLARSIPVVEALMAIPGCGIVCACRFVAIVADPNRFRSPGAFTRYCRLGVRIRESNGARICPDRLDRSGNPSLKDVSRTIFNRALASKAHNAIKVSYEKSLERTGNPDHARLNTQRKIMLAMLAMWKTGETYSGARFLGEGA